MQSIPEISRGEILERVAAARDHASQRGWHGLVAVARSFYDLPGNVAYLSGHFPPFPGVRRTLRG